ncbi:MAG TPA: hypothetical protein VND23_00355 [Acidimicrobiales bacterium]|nr:hypothetical protein [Acidimicrobiales bacterium]
MDLDVNRTDRERARAATAMAKMGVGIRSDRFPAPEGVADQRARAMPRTTLETPWSR